MARCEICNFRTEAEYCPRCDGILIEEIPLELIDCTAKMAERMEERARELVS